MTIVDRRAAPPSRPTPPPAMPEFVESRLAHGFRVRVARVARLPEVAIQLVANAGSAFESSPQAGVAALTARVLQAGAGGRSAMELAGWLDHMGASVGSGVGYDSARFSVHSLSDTLDDALDYLSTVLLAPDFPDEEVARVRAERMDEVRRSADEPVEVAGEVLSEAIFGAHPYGRSVRGQLDTLEALNRDAVEAFWQASYRPGEAFLVAAGDVDPDRFFDRLENRFDQWSPGEPSGPVEVFRGPAAAAGEVILVDRPGSEQSEIRVGALGLARGEPDEVPVLVMNAILGGLFNSRLNLNLREDKGWTYGARSGFSLRRAPGPFVARAAVDTPVTARAFEEMLAEIASMTERPPSEEEMELAKNALVLSLPRQFETTSQVAAKEAERVGYGLPKDWWETLPRRVREVGVEDVIRVAAKYLDRKGLTLVAVGDATRIRSDLGSLGHVRDRYEP
ncbi:MAG: pitrilysin family protein [Gemmatimonadota bacterium]|jgi:zinc protease